MLHAANMNVPLVVLGGDILCSVRSFSRFSAVPRKSHLDKVIKMCRYLKDFLNREIMIEYRDITVLENILGPKDLIDQYPGAQEELEMDFPGPFGPVLQMVFTQSRRKRYWALPEKHLVNMKS